jgi:hypothetical protein
MRREIERAIDEAVNPKGVSTHSGMARINAATLQRLLAIADATETVPRAAKREPATDEQVAEADENHAPSWLDYRDGWRDAEKFHNIKEFGVTTPLSSVNNKGD